MEYNKIIEQIDSEINLEDDCFTILGNNISETELIGTKDALLNLVKCLLKAVYEPEISYEEKNVDCNISAKMLNFPSFQIPYIVNITMYNDKIEMIKYLKEVYESDKNIIRAIENDPQFW